MCMLNPFTTCTITKMYICSKTLDWKSGGRAWTFSGYGQGNSFTSSFLNIIFKIISLKGYGQQSNKIDNFIGSSESDESFEY